VRRQPLTQFESIAVRKKGDVAIVELMHPRAVDPADVALLRKELSALVEDGRAAKLIINLHRVQFLPSAVINVLVVMEKKARQQGGGIRLCRLRPEIEEVLKITGLDKWFKLDVDEELALAAWGRQGS